MPTAMLGSVLRVVRRHFGALDATACDRDLLVRFAAERDEAAFSALVARHGRMVLGVCQRVLRHDQAAEDAFQACFLVLARKAGSSAWQTSIGGWLHEAARRIACKLRAGRPHLSLEAHDPGYETATDSDLREVRDLELAALPEHYRTPIVLCALEARSLAEAAGMMGCAVGTVKSRMARGRDLLRQRLVKRGVAVSNAAALLDSAVVHAFPAALGQSTVSAAVAFAQGALSNGAAAELATSVIRGTTKAKLAGALVLLVMTGFIGVALALQSPAPSEEKPLPPPLPDRVVDADLETPLPAGAVVRLGTTRFRAGGQSRVDVSPDGKFVASADITGGLLLWEAETGKLRRRLGDERSPPAQAFFSSDGKLLLANLAGKNTVSVWTVPEGKLARSFKVDQEIWQVALSQDGRTLALAVGSISGKTAEGHNQYKGHIELRDLETDRVLRTFGTFVPNYVTALQFHADGKSLLAVAPVDGIVSELTCFDSTDGKVQTSFRIDVPWHARGAFTPDGRFFATGSVGITLWDPRTGKQVATAAKDFGRLGSFLLLPDGKAAIIDDPGQHVTNGLGQSFEVKPPRTLIWDLKNDREIRVFAKRIQPEALSRDGKTIITQNFWGVMSRWDATTGKQLPPILDEHDSPVTGLGFSPDSKAIFTSAMDERHFRWDARTGKRTGVAEKVDRAWRFRLTPDGKTLVAGGFYDLNLFDARTLKRLPNPSRILIANGAFDLSPDGKTLATLGGDRLLRFPMDPAEVVPAPREIILWDMETREKHRILTRPDKKLVNVGPIAYSPKGDVFASAAIEQSALLDNPKPTPPVIEIWDPATGKILRQWKAADIYVVALQFSADGSRLLAASQTGTICLYDSATGKQLLRIQHEGMQPFNLHAALSPDGKLIASADHFSNAVRFWDAKTGKLRREFRGHLGPVQCLTFSPDGALLATGGADTTVLVLDVKMLLK